MSFKDELAAQVAQRRTFAIISHPDAGKTTMTEKLLLWGQAIQVAGMVKSRKSDRAATSDWMEMERAWDFDHHVRHAVPVQGQDD